MRFLSICRLCFIDAWRIWQISLTEILVNILADRGNRLKGLVKGNLLLGAVPADKIIAEIMDEIDQFALKTVNLLGARRRGTRGEGPARWRRCPTRWPRRT